MKDKLIFDALKREGECWHEWVEQPPLAEWEKRQKYVRVALCSCGEYNCSQLNLDFSTWPGFGWIMERLPEWERRSEFLAWLQCHYLMSWGDALLFDFINPTAMRDALIKFIEGE